LNSLGFYLPFLSSICRNHAWMRAAGTYEDTSAQSYPHVLWDRSQHSISIQEPRTMYAETCPDVGHNRKASI
jgi:hypothetical protein